MMIHAFPGRPFMWLQGAPVDETTRSNWPRVHRVDKGEYQAGDRLQIKLSDPTVNILLSL